MTYPTIEIHPDPAALALAAAQHFVRAATAAVAERSRFTVALAGGSTPAELYRLLSRPPYREQIPWEQTLVFFGDERCVPPDHLWSNYRMAREALLDHVPLSPANIHRMAGELAPADAAADYARVIRRTFGLRGAARPVFDLILLGMGDDGHTASLFPGMPALAERRRLVAATDVPGYVQPAVARITLTYPVLNAARHVMFLVAGASKAAKVRAVLGAGQVADADLPDLAFSAAPRISKHPERRPAAVRGPQSKDAPSPAALVHPTTGRLTWLLDCAAAGLTIGTVVTPATVPLTRLPAAS